MPVVKVGPRHQITIPQEVRKSVGIEAGDLLDVQVHRGQLVIVPQVLVSRKPTARLSSEEQELLTAARRKISAINDDILTSTGLTREEADVAAAVGLIDASQKYWWLEEWQEGEREAARDERDGHMSGPFETADELIAHLNQQRT